MNMKQLMRFLAHYRSAIWPIEEIQIKWMENNLGRAYWSKKIEQFRVVREDAGLELL
jgi:hypothetical protein